VRLVKIGAILKKSYLWMNCNLYKMRAA